MVCKIVPEWNLRDVTDPDSDFLLHLLRFRATTTLLEQYGMVHPLNSSGGDYGHIMDMICTRNLRHVNEFRLRNSFTLFLDDDENYGRCYTSTSEAHHRETLDQMDYAFKTGIAVPQTTAEFIFMRQSGVLQSLNIIMEDILEIGSTTRSQKKAPERDTDAATATMGQLTVQSRPTRLSLPELLDTANDQTGSCPLSLSYSPMP